MIGPIEMQNTVVIIIITGITNVGLLDFITLTALYSLLLRTLPQKGHYFFHLRREKSYSLS